MNLLGIESADYLPSSLTHDPRVYSRVLTEEDLRKEKELNKEREDKKKEYLKDREYKYHKKMEDHNERKQEREHKDHKESGHHDKEPEERERHSPNRSKPDPQLLLQALTPRDVRILVQAEEELSQTKVKLFVFQFGFLREAPTKKVPLLFGHCPKCDCTPPPHSTGHSGALYFRTNLSNFVKSPF